MHSVMKALSHPRRLAILAILIDHVASPNEISNELGEKVTNVSYHVNVLRDHGLVVEDSNRPRRGAIEHFYRAVVPTLIPPGIWDDLPDGLRRGVSAHILMKALDDVRESLKAGIFDSPPGELSWIPLVLDELGVEEFGKACRAFIELVMTVQTNASKRLPRKKADRAAVATSATVLVAGFLSSRSPKDDQNAAAMKRR